MNQMVSSKSTLGMVFIAALALVVALIALTPGQTARANHWSWDTDPEIPFNLDDNPSCANAN